MQLDDLVNDTHELVGAGEADHREPAFQEARNALFARLADRGFRSFALETDRTAAFAVDDYVREGTGTLDAAMDDGFSHGFGAFDGNRRLVEWMRDYNRDREPADRLAFHGIDGPFEFTAPGPRAALEHVRDHLGLDLDIASLAGEDERWSRTEAVTDPAASPGDTPEARELGALADRLLAAVRDAPPAARPRAAYHRALAHALTARGLLRYHRQAAQPLAEAERWSRLSGVRDALMAEHLRAIRDQEADRGPTLVAGHNIHLQRTESRLEMAGMNLTWTGTGALMAALLGPKYLFIAGSLGPAGPGDHGGADAVLVAGDEPALVPVPGGTRDRATGPEPVEE
ncbi:erythromycin esterase family protein [Glycomyces scopariae]